MNVGLDSLASLVRDTQAASVGRQALLLRLDQLPPPLRRPHHQRLARAALDPLLDADRGRLHELPAGRVAVSWRGDAAVSLRSVMAALGHLLLDAPAGTPPLDTLTTLFQLPQDGSALLAAARAGVELDTRVDQASDATSTEAAPLDATMLASLEASLSHADVERFVRRRPVCAVGADALTLAWEERVLNLGEIAEELVPGYSLTADPWLFRRLARTLDRRLLALLATPGILERASPFGLSLGLESLVSPEFLRFDAGLPGRLRGRVVVGFTLADVLTDPTAFAFARDFARARGYQILLRRVAARALQMLTLPRLGVDFLRITGLVANQAVSADLSNARLILGDADEPASLSWAREHGIAYVQGRAARPIA